MECRTCPPLEEDNGDDISQNEGRKSALFIGTSGFSTHKRWTEHFSAVRRGRTEESGLAKHQEFFHPGLPPNFTGKAIGGNPKNLYRYVGESLFIERMSRNRRVTLMNGRGEWGRTPLPRLGLVEGGIAT